MAYGAKRELSLHLMCDRVATNVIKWYISHIHESSWIDRLYDA